MSSLLIGKKAPQFKAKAVANGQIVDDFSLDMFTNKHVLFFFYPLDFTFVCPTELHAFQERLQDFHSRETEVVGCSVDSHFTHLAWVNTPKNKGGIEGVTYPLVSDLNKTIAKDYHVLNDEEGIAFRGLYLIDKQGVIRHQLINDLPIGRSVDEALRVIDALIFHEKHGDVCPANWKSGDKSMQPTQEGLNSYFG
ncbi:peroxiredoxin [Simkania sp.]|uniref:peroxiredoxin n=1 Tax=Simkania sp. TaxID=34094 RepID=UPI003B518D66